jgi:hypothetical protein
LYRVVAWHKLGPSLKSPPLIIDGQSIENVGEKAKALQKKILERYNANNDLEKDPLANWSPEKENPGLA